MSSGGHSVCAPSTMLCAKARFARLKHFIRHDPDGTPRPLKARPRSLTQVAESPLGGAAGIARVARPPRIESGPGLSMKAQGVILAYGHIPPPLSTTVRVSASNANRRRRLKYSYRKPLSRRGYDKRDLPPRAAFAPSPRSSKSNHGRALNGEGAPDNPAALSSPSLLRRNGQRTWQE